MKKSVVMSILLISGVLLAACQPANTSKADEIKSAASASADSRDAHTASRSSPTPVASLTAANASANQVSQNGAPKQIDWALVDSSVKAVDKASFKYPFELNSEPVKAYAQMYHVDNETSRYNLTVGMAVNEVLSKVLDQVDTAYVSHELMAGKDSTFIIHTTQQIVPSEHTYVFAEPFAKGLTIPVKVVNDGKK